MSLFVDICFHFSWLNIQGWNCRALDRRMFNFKRNWQSVLQSTYTIIHSHQQCMRVPVVPYLSQHLSLSAVVILTILIDVKWYLVVLTCISLMTNDIEHIFMYLLVICKSFVKCLFKLFALLKPVWVICYLQMKEFWLKQNPYVNMQIL